MYIYTVYLVVQSDQIHATVHQPKIGVSVGEKDRNTSRENASRAKIYPFHDRTAVNGTLLSKPVNSSVFGRPIRSSMPICSDGVRSGTVRTHIMPTRNPVPVNQLLPIILSEKVHPTGGSLQPVPTFTPWASSPAHWSSIAQPSCYTTPYASRAPPFPLWGGRVVQPELLPDQGDLGMISRIPHTTTPGHLAGLE